MADGEKTDVLKDLEIKLTGRSGTGKEAVEEEKDKLEKRLLTPIYQAGIASTQEEYEKNYDLVFQALDELEEKLGQRNYLLGDEITEADVRLYSILVRFDSIFYFAFRLNRNQIQDFPNLWRYVRALYHREEFRAVTDFQRLKEDFYLRQTDIENPYHLVANGPDVSIWEEA